MESEKQFSGIYQKLLKEEKMKKVAIVSAMAEETKYTHEYLAGRDDWVREDEEHYINKKAGMDVIVKVLGVGKVNAAFRTADLIKEFCPELIVNIGVSGGLAERVKRGTVAIGESYIQTDFQPYKKENNPKINNTSEEIIRGLAKEAKNRGFDYIVGKLATGDFFLNDESVRKSIIAEYHPISFDMETAAIAQVATAKDIEFAAIRIFSDLADEDAVKAIENPAPDEEELLIRKKLATRPTEIIVGYLEKEII